MPASPARAASTAAFSERMLVWKAISSITRMIFEILSLDEEISRIETEHLLELLVGFREKPVGIAVVFGRFPRALRVPLHHAIHLFGRNGGLFERNRLFGRALRQRLADRSHPHGRVRNLSAAVGNLPAHLTQAPRSFRHTTRLIST